ncbi:MAG: trypsin-like peptidase domain-containing protein [Clostridia bacterium]|nr:trypsin-like peptidase domain-containing protein [Clostridia bacterium]
MCEINPDKYPSSEEATEGKQTAATPAEWYGVSYPAAASQACEGVRAPRRRAGALVALIVACVLLLSALAGLGGYLVATHLLSLEDTEESAPPPAGGGITPEGSPEGSIPESAAPVGDAASYDYASAVIQKNDGSTLVGSANGSAGTAAKSLIEAIAAVRDSVVEISTETISGRGQLTAGAGSGVIIHADGIIVTNNHVIDGVSNIYVRLTNGNTYEAYLRGTDEENDIAILKITPLEALTVARLGCSSALALGEEVFAIGNPLGQLGGTVTNGIISALEREVEMEENLTMTLIQTNAAINAGNSGGALFNMAGELIGVVNAKFSATGVEGLGFAIPIDTAVLSVNDLLDYGYIPGLPTLGVTLVDRTVNYFYTLPYVYEAPAGAPLQEGDLVVAVDGTQVSTTSALKRLLRSKYEVGDTVTLTIYRKNAQNQYNATDTVTVTLVEEVPSAAGVRFE